MADPTSIGHPAETALAALFNTSKASLPGDVGPREDAFRRFASQGLPHRRVEEWKYTDLRAAMQAVAPLASPPTAGVAGDVAARPGVFPGVDALTLTIVDGYVSRESSDLTNLPAGLTVSTLSDALGRGDALLSSLGAVEAAKENAAYALNAAFMTDGVLLRVGAGVRLERPVHLRFVVTGASAVATATRVLVVAEEGADLTVLESHESENGVAHQLNGVVEFVVHDRAAVSHIRLDRSGDAVLGLSTVTARLGAGVTFDSYNAVAGTRLSRHQVFVTFAGRDSEAGIRGSTMLSGRQHADSTLVVEHIAEGCRSRELFKTVVDDEATGVFQGKIVVQAAAQKTDGRMMSAAVLLSEGAAMNNKPELEIFADDVQCGHGATCGELDDDLLFYLMARGLPRKEAEALLLESFLGEAAEEGIADETIRAAVTGVIGDWLARRG